MKKLLLASTALAIGGALATPAAADVFVTGTITKDELIVVRETVTEVKIATITVTRAFEGTSASQAVSVYNQRVTGNSLRKDIPDAVATPTGEIDPLTFNCPGCGPAATSPLTASIAGSFSNNTGVVMWNQDVGNNINQANNVTLAVVANAYIARSTNSAEQITNGNVSFVYGFFPTVTKSAAISTSVNTNTGVTFINQNAGYAGNQYNSLTGALSTGNGAAVALADADLGQWNQSNRTYDINSTRTATIAGSVNSNTGVTGVNQNTGNFNNQATIISFAGGR